MRIRATLSPVAGNDRTHDMPRASHTRDPRTWERSQPRRRPQQPRLTLIAPNVRICRWALGHERPHLAPLSCQGVGCRSGLFWLVVSPGCGLSEVPVCGVEPVALESVVVPDCPPGLAFSRLSWSSSMRLMKGFRHRLARQRSHVAEYASSNRSNVHLTGRLFAAGGPRSRRFVHDVGDRTRRALAQSFVRRHHRWCWPRYRGQLLRSIAELNAEWPTDRDPLTLAQGAATDAR